MIKVSFYTKGAEDICYYIEKNITQGMPVEQWLAEKAEGLVFDCEDFPHDLEQFYDCYFTSVNDDEMAKHVLRLLKKNIREDSIIKYSVWITDEFLKERELIGRN